MGIVPSDLKNNSALCAVGAFIITRTSFDYFFANREEERTNALKKLIIGAFLFEAGKIITTTTLTTCPKHS